MFTYTIDELISRYPVLSSSKKAIEEAAEKLIASYEKGGKLLVCGNGGSCSDADHIAGELMKGFKSHRPLGEELANKINEFDPTGQIASSLQQGLPVIALHNHAGLNSAFSNDVMNGAEYVYAQQVNVYGGANDVFLGISTSGNAKNVAAGAKVAKAKGVTVIGLTGRGGGELGRLADILIAVDESETFKVQELHLPIYHYLCLKVEEYFFGNKK